MSGDWQGDDNSPNVLFIGEAPGREENNRHRVFIGRTGEEFNNTYLPLAGLARSGVSMTNTVKCHWADSSDAPPDDIVKSCSEFHLRKELAAHNPDMVVLMGGTANSLLDLDIDMEHGLLRTGKILGWSGPIYSTFHPALGMHMSNKMKALLDDFRKLKGVLRGEVQPLKSRPLPHFERLYEPEQVSSLLIGNYWEDIAVDTESKKRWKGYTSTIKYIPWCLTFAIDDDHAYMIRVEEMAALKEFFRHFRRFRRAIFHNSGYDYMILSMMLDAIGLGDWMIDWNKVQDTMSMAYFDGRLAKGLKSLSYRELGSKMRSFDDVVIPHSREFAVEYLMRAMAMVWPKPVQEPTGMTTTKKCPDCKGTTILSIGKGKARKTYPCDCKMGEITIQKMTRKQSMNDKLSRLGTDLSKNPNIDLWERWEGWEGAVEPLIHKIGPIPLPSIEYVPELEAIEYACGDAIQTRRLFPHMQERLIRLRRDLR